METKSTMSPFISIKIPVFVDPIYDSYLWLMELMIAVSLNGVDWQFFTLIGVEIRIVVWNMTEVASL
jgi:hypothetical protein